MTVWRFGSRSILRLRTHLSPEECWARLDTVAEPYRWFVPWQRFFGIKPLLVQRSGDNLVLIVRTYYSEGYACHFYGRIVPSNGGTLIEGEFKLPQRLRTLRNFSFIFWTAVPAAALVFDGGRHGLASNCGLVLFCGLGGALTAAWWWHEPRRRNPMRPLLEMTWEAVPQ